MKKFISIFLVLTVVFMTVFSANAFDAATESDVATNTDVATGSDVVPDPEPEPEPEPEKTLYDQFYEEFSTAETARIKFSMTNYIMGVIPDTISYDIACDKGAISATVKRGLLKQTIIIKDGIASGYFTYAPIFYFKYASPALENEDFSPQEIYSLFLLLSLAEHLFSDLEPIGTYEKTSWGKTYTVEEYKSGENFIVRFEFSENQLIAVETENIHDKDTRKRFGLEISYDVDESDFKLPFYSIINITPFFIAN